jgi:hypothetical protein
VVVAVGETVRDPEGPDAEKPVPLQVFAFVLLHTSVADWPLGIERPKAESCACTASCAAAGCAAKRQRANARLKLRAIMVVASFVKIKKAGLMKIISAGRIRARTPNGTHDTYTIVLLEAH